MTTLTHPLSSLIGSRICHDLISPVGAITNGLELLTLSGQSASPEMALIADSVENAEARIRFFRIAYGVAGQDQTSPAEVAGILRDIRQAGRVTMIWDVAGDVSRAEVQLAFLALQCVETALAYGGTARVRCDTGRWQVIGEADRLNVQPDLWADLARGETSATITPALVQFALLPELARAAGRQLEVAQDGSALRLLF